jgi:hypothetical protein
MKNKLIFIGVLLVITALSLFSCEKKKSEGIAPTYGTTGNPHPGEQTVTGTTTYSNPATENSSFSVGGSGWSNPTCGSTKSLTLKGFSDNTDVTLSFAKAIQTGTYGIATLPAGTTACALTVVNAPGQPAGIIWYGKNGIVTINTTSTSITASFNNIICTQKNFNFPTVTVGGVLGCSQ